MCVVYRCSGGVACGGVRVVCVHCVVVVVCVFCLC